MRSIGEMFYWIEMFKQIGVRVWFASNRELNSDDSKARLLLSLDGFKAEGSNEERQHKSINGHTKAIAEGRYTFPPKPGYMKGDRPGVHIPHPDEFLPLQQAFREVINGHYAPSEALKRLNGSSFTSHRSALKADKFNAFAQDAYYAGIIEVNKQVKTRNEHGQHQAMLTLEEHNALKTIIAGKKRPKFERKSHNPEFPLNKTPCHDCDGRLVGFNHTNGKGWHKPKYRCRSCGKQYHRDELHQSLNNILTPLRLDEGDRTDFIAALAEVWELRQRDTLKHLSSLRKRYADLKQAKDKLAIELVSNPSRRVDMEEAMDAVKADMVEVDTAIRKASNVQGDLVGFVAFALEFTEQLQTKWWELSHESRLECKQLLFPEGFSVSRDKKVYTPKISPLYRLATIKKDLRIDRKSLLVELRGIAPRSASLLAVLLQA